jgi:hypothetical protein
MAFNFPNAPVAGDVFQPSGGPTYRYSGSVWSVLATPFQGAFPSDSPPLNPVSGQLWWESDTGLLYVYYTDANSSQWVEVVSSGLPGAVRFDVAQTLSATEQAQALTNIGAGVYKVAGGTTAVTQASTTFAIPTGYQAFELFIDNVVVNGLTSLYLNYSWDGGATFPQGGSQYNYAGDKLDSSTGAGAWVGTGGASDSAYIAFAVGVSTLRPNIKAMWQVPAAGENLSGHAFAVYSTGSALRFDRTAFCSNAVLGPPTHGRFAATGGFTIAAGCKWQLNGIK